MSKIAIVTDSTAYLTKEETERHNITVLPLTVNFSDGFIYDGLVDNKEFFARVDKEAELPSTSQPSVGLFVEAYNKLLDEGKEIVSIHLSARLSGTCDSARQAAQMVDPEKITIVDTKTTSSPLALLVLATAKWTQEGVSREEIVARLTQAVDEVGSYFIVGSLDYLKKGGRIGGAQAFVGSVLQIIPLLQFLDGVVSVFDKVRTRKRAIKKLLDLLPKNDKPLKVAIIHGDALDDALKLKEMTLEAVPHADVMVREFGPVINMHGGPGTLGVGFWAMDEKHSF